MRLLILTHTFPPSTHANAKRPHYIAKGFLEAGWQVDVFTHPAGIPVAAAESTAHPSLRVFRLEDPVTSLLQRLKPQMALHRLVTLTAAGLMWPDVYAWWARKVFGAIRARPAYDRTLAFVLPSSMLLSGRCRGLVDETWTFDYQESVTPQQRRQRRRSPLQRLLLPRLAALERRTLHKAGRVVFTADSNRQVYINEGLVEESATAHVPYFYDAPAFAHPVKPGTTDFEVAYFGTFDWRGNRSPETFLRALARFLEQTPQARSRARFVFYGPWLAEHDRFVDGLNLRDVVSIRPAVGYGRYLEAVRGSQVLLLVVAPEHNLFMPSKIVDYFGARRPIMAFVPPESEMRGVLSRAGMADYVSDPADVQGGTAALSRLWELFLAGKLTVDAGKTALWSSDAQMPRYIEAVLSAGRPCANPVV
jgi:glycosyltransferase involved in cell wall biosynthesis